MLVGTNKARRIVARHIARMSEAASFRKGTLGVATRNTIRSAKAMRRAAAQNGNDELAYLAEFLSDSSRWDL